ncbi:class I SAM-dependent methyltransferase [Microbacterium phyllosphaerae]|uniref:class I SAM-dependent methyltransferase n=1 Tax=Microbacterium phyllosphaerae TaxID=124798 RepID=UPI0021684E1C|nr:class I SAM-dependent methyltransferase [Microbacterium phyllosphaerae]MCS3441868.1 SAM-dependent methyltransferase [Microbacterium phyllosphaerae]
MSADRATSFGAEAANYEAGRPEYPFDAVAWMLERMPADSRRIVDVGAGTGKLTRVLSHAPGAEVVAVDPDPAMLAALRQNVPGVPTFQGTAEQMPLPDASIDAAVLGQTWHWVEPITASAELGRVVRSGGVLGLIWNIRDESTAWVRRLTDVMHSSPAENMVNGPESEGPRIAAPFGEVETQRWEWNRPMTRTQLHQMALSRSYLITAPADERAEITRQMDALFDELGLDGESTIDLPYVTHAFRAVRG